MMSLFEGLVEYYRVTGEYQWRQSFMNLFHNIIEQEITIIGNGGGPGIVHGEGWNNTALKQINPFNQRMMETCVGVTWLKLCTQILRLTGDPLAMDMIEKYVYNGLIGAMKPEGDGFSYVNLLNGVKTNPEGWGATINDVYVTCCNLNGPMGLAYLPYIAVMNSNSGPVVNLYEKGVAKASTPKGNSLNLKINSDYPVSGNVSIDVEPEASEVFTVKLRIPEWSNSTELTVNGEDYAAVAGTYAEIHREWAPGDQIELQLDMRCRLIEPPVRKDGGNHYFQALVRGPVVLARDENVENQFDWMGYKGITAPVSIISKNGYVDVIPEEPTIEGTLMQFRVPVSNGYIPMVDYASVNNWNNGKHICTWLPKKR